MRQRLLFLMVCGLVVCGMAAQGARAAQGTAKIHRVVFVITSPETDDWHSGMILADHFVAGVKPAGATVEVLAYGGGIETLKKGSVTTGEIANLQALGVHFVACENAMRAHHILPEDLLPGVSHVPSGVVELVEKQESGWAYVKVGR